MVRLGIIGTNFITDWMLAAKEQVPQLTAAAVYSRKEETGRAFADKYGLGPVFTDLQAFAESDLFDAVYIASPTFCHYDQAKLMLENGKHVLCEKPGVLTAAQTGRLVALARENNLVYLEAMRLVFDDALPIMLENLPKIGRLRRAVLDFSQYSSRYDRVRAGETGINAFDPTLCNAALMDMGCYCVHGLVSMFGKPEKISAHAYFLENGFEGGGSILLHYKDFTGEAVYSKVAQQANPSVLQGEDGAILLDNINHIRRIWLQPRKGDAVDLPYAEKLPNNLMFELREFCQYVETGTQPEKRNRDSIWAMEILDEARKQTGVHFPADDWAEP